MKALSNLLNTALLFLISIILGVFLPKAQAQTNVSPFHIPPIQIPPFHFPTWNVPGVAGTISALVVGESGQLYVGGGFHGAGNNVNAQNIAEWIGNTWLALGTGMNYPVDSLAISGNNLYAGGIFTEAGGKEANQIAQWDGSSWSPLNSGVNGEVKALAVIGTNLFVGGDFTNAGGVYANNIAEWNGRSWSALGSGISSKSVQDSPAIVSALAVIGTNLIVGGTFNLAGDTAATNLAEWNGYFWTSIGPVTGSNASVNAFVLSDNDLFVGGSFSMAGGIPATNIAKWSENSWSALGSGISGMTVYPANTAVRALTVSGDSLFAGGNFSMAGTISASNIAAWNHTSWSSLGSGLSGVGGIFPVVDALAASGTNLFVGGEFITAGSTSVCGIARWNGNSWSAMFSRTNSE